MRNAVVGNVLGNVVQVGSATLVPPEARPVAVAGLPPPAVFVGREAELARLGDALRPGAPEAVLVWSIGGLPGVGKTALAVFAARRAIEAGWFPGGVVMTDLRGYDDPQLRVTASTALASLLGALGVAGGHIPPGAEDRARLWRSILADRERMLVLADNVSDPDQVLPLLPGTTRHQVLITSRHRLAGLDHARLLDLDVLDQGDAVRMLAEVLRMGDPQDTRTHDLAACERVARLCGRLPLAVRVAAALLVAEPERSVPDLAEALADERNRLRELDHGGSLAVRAAFDLSYRQLSTGQAELLRLAALDPGPDVGTDTVAAIAGTDRATALRGIRALRAAHLVQPAQQPDRWRMHDLVKLYAAEKAADPERGAAITRLLDHYLGLVRDSLDQERYLRHEAEVIRWLDTERANLVAITDLARAENHPRHLVGLALGLNEYLAFRRLWTERIAVQYAALSAARSLDDVAAEAQLLVDLGYAHRWNRFFEDAVNHLRDALPLFRSLGDRVGFGTALNRLGELYRETGRPGWAMACHRWARDLFRAAGDVQGHFSTLHNMAVLHRQQHNHDRALALHLEAMALVRELHLPLLEGRTLDHLGLTYREMGRFDDAIEHHRQNLRIAQEAQDHHGYARTMTNLAVTYRVAGRPAEAVDCHLRVVHVLRGLGARGELATALRELASTYRELGQDDEAARCSLEADRTDPADRP